MLPDKSRTPETCDNLLEKLMARLPSRTYSETAAANILLELKKGKKDALDEFVWQNQERFYCIAYVATLDPDLAEQITIAAFGNAIRTIRQTNLKQITSVWEWLSGFIVDAVGQHHQINSSKPPGPLTDPTMDGSAQMDWETTVILGAQRIKRCIGMLSEEQKKTFILRHQLGLNIEQMAIVLNEHPENILAWLHRSRVQVVKCLGRG